MNLTSTKFANKCSLVLTLSFILFSFTCVQSRPGEPDRAQPSLREKININRDWKFKLGDYPGAEAIVYNDMDWSSIHLPHSFDLPYFMSNYYVGYGWYRKTFKIDPTWTSKRVSLQFEGAFQTTEVFVNGMRVGEHKGGFTGFCMDVTAAVHPGENVIAVRLNNIRDNQLEPIAGDHTFIGGIYRDVYLVVTNPLHVAWYGTFVTTPVVTKDSAIVNVQTEMQNEAATSSACTLKTHVLDPDGKQVAELTSSQLIPAHATVIFNQTSLALPKPKLWHPDHPYLYCAVTTVLKDIAPVDSYQTTFGIRSIKWTADQGFFLNGEHLYFHGANVHQDHAGWGDAITDYGAYRDVKLVKEAGLDFIRGSHYPHHPAFAKACDELGLLFWSENCFWAAGPGSGYPLQEQDQAGFDQSAEDTLRDMIRIFRNHPSIVVWSMCNEVFFSNHQDKVKALLAKLVNETHQLDPTRPAAIGGCQRGGLDKIGDVAGYNGDGACIAEYQNPGLPNVVSEYGSSICDRGDPNGDHYNGGFYKNQLDATTPEYPWRSGQVLWCAFDYSTIFGHFGHMGFIDYFRIPKKSWYWYREHFRNIPPPEWPKNGTPTKLVLTADKTTIQGTDATDDCQILVTVQDKEGKPLSNSSPVTFTVESGPGEFPTGRSITFSPASNDPKSDIVISNGLAAIEFRSYFGGQSVIRATSLGLSDGLITITTNGDPKFVPGQSPLAPNRPYVVKGWIKNQCTPLDEKIRKITDLDNCAINHPVSSSGDAPSHEARFINDGDVKTVWQANGLTSNPWCQIDLESLCSIQGVETTFGEKGPHPFVIEGSTDGEVWKMLVDRKRATGSGNLTRRDICLPNENCRYLRFTFISPPVAKPASVAEIKIFALHAR